MSLQSNKNLPTEPAPQSAVMPSPEGAGPEVHPSATSAKATAKKVTATKTAAGKTAAKKAPTASSNSAPVAQADAGELLDSLIAGQNQHSQQQNPQLNSNVDEPPGEAASDHHTDKNTVLKQWELDQVANRELRDKYAEKAYELSIGCITFWMLMISAQGIIKGVTGVSMLGDSVLMSVTAGVTVNVLAAFLGVIRGLFPNNSNDKKGKRETSKGKGKK